MGNLAGFQKLLSMPKPGPLRSAREFLPGEKFSYRLGHNRIMWASYIYICTIFKRCLKRQAGNLCLVPLRTQLKWRHQEFHVNFPNTNSQNWTHTHTHKSSEQVPTTSINQFRKPQLMARVYSAMNKTPPHLTAQLTTSRKVTLQSHPLQGGKPTLLIQAQPCSWQT